MATRRPRRQPPILPVAPGANGGTAALAAGTGAAATTFGAGSAGAAVLGMATATAATRQLVDRSVAALSSTLRRIAALRLARQREALQRSGYTDDVITAALRRETELEAIFQRRSTERMKKAMQLALQAPDASARAAAVEAATRREQVFARQRALASGARVFSSIERAALEGQSPSGAYWKLGIAAEHTPDCEAMAGKFWPWEILRRIHPLLHPGCKCKLLSYGEALAAGLLTPSAILTLEQARALAGPVLAYVEKHHAQENEALAELLIRSELALVEGADLDFLAAAPLLAEPSIEQEEDEEEPEAEPEPEGAAA
jgi:hypothetical protein